MLLLRETSHRFLTRGLTIQRNFFHRQKDVKRNVRFFNYGLQKFCTNTSGKGNTIFGRLSAGNIKNIGTKTLLTLGLGSGTLLRASLIELNEQDEDVYKVSQLILSNSCPSDEDKKYIWYEFFTKYILPELAGLILAICCAFGAAAINIRIPTLLGDVINVLNRQFNERLNYAEYFELLRDPIKKIAATYLIQGLLTCAYISVLSKVGENISCSLRKNLFDSLLKQDITFFDERKSGEIIERLTSDVQDFKSSFKLCISQGLKSITQTTGCVVSMYSISPKLTLIMAGVIPLLVAIGASIGSLLRKLSYKAQDKTAEATGTASEAISNIRTVRAFAMENIESEKFYDELLQATFLNQLLGFGIGVFQGVTNIALNGIVLGMIYSGGYLVNAQEMNPGQLMSFLVASQMIQRSLASISILFGTAVRGSSAANRVFEFIHHKPDMNLEGGKKIPFHCLIGDINFDNVSFAYKSRPHNQVLNNFSLNIPHCKVVALCGLSGGGKTTIASLIERFYDPTSGSVSIDGHDLRTLDPSWLRRNVIGYINQEPILFATSIEENIRYGKPEATFEEVEAAAKLANADNFIREFKDGYQTVVGERGCTLSGGQKQRIAIARALIKNPTILILDEATSALDSESEKLVQDALSKVMVGRTVLIIAHRLSTIQNADIIAVISNGQVVEHGNHKELKSKRGIYAELIRQQSML